MLTEHRGGESPEFHLDHPLGRHRRKIPDRVVFEHLIDALVHGSGYERIATVGCSDRTIRRLTEWGRLGIAQKIHAVAPAGYDLIIGLDLADLSVDGCITKAPVAETRPARPPSTGANKDSSAPPPPRPTVFHWPGVRGREPARLTAAGAHPRQPRHPQVGPMPEQITAHLDAALRQQTPAESSPGELGFSGEISRERRYRYNPVMSGEMQHY